MLKFVPILVKTLIAMTLLLFFIGCAGAQLKNFGRLEPSTAAKEHFEKFVINDDYNYFLSGSDTYPTAIFGLKKNYKIDSNEELWKKIELKQEVISELVTSMQMRLMECCYQSHHGFDILDNQDRKIGEWYSMLELIVIIETKEEGKVIIYPPSDTDAVKRYQGRLGKR